MSPSPASPRNPYTLPPIEFAGWLLRQLIPSLAREVLRLEKERGRPDHQDRLAQIAGALSALPSSGLESLELTRGEWDRITPVRTDHAFGAPHAGEELMGSFNRGGIALLIVIRHVTGELPEYSTIRQLVAGTPRMMSDLMLMGAESIMAQPGASPADVEAWAVGAVNTAVDAYIRAG